MLHHKLQIQKATCPGSEHKGVKLVDRKYGELELMVSLRSSSLFLPTRNARSVMSYPLIFKEKSIYSYLRKISQILNVGH